MNDLSGSVSGSTPNLMNVVGVQFRRAGKIYDFLTGEMTLHVGDQVVVDTDRGATVGRVVKVDAKSSVDVDPASVKPVIRMATERDLDEVGHFSHSQVMDIARSRVEVFKLDMRIMKVEMQMSGNKITIYFSSPGRVDFRDLVKDMAAALRARVELKQVGARDEAKLVGGVGICGREYCCSSFLRDFVPVSIKMAKNQNLALNPSKVSGGCGRLLCCLTYENDAYIDLRRKLPGLKARVRSLTDSDYGVVIKTDILNQLVVFETPDGRLVTAKAKDIEIVDKSQAAQKDAVDSEAEMWAEDIDLGLLMGEGENRGKPDGQRSAQGGQGQQSQRGDQRHRGSDRRQHRDQDQRGDRRHGSGRPGEQGNKGGQHQKGPHRSEQSSAPHNKNQGPKR
jgi:cell fate regulator YaaT (PSP1 superfamily)